MDIGHGIAYHTGNPDHLLNLRAANMSALPDQPDHFWSWLSSREFDVPFNPDPYCFVSRRIYGNYIASLLDQHTSDPANVERLSIDHGSCVDIDADLGILPNCLLTMPHGLPLSTGCKTNTDA